MTERRMLSIRMPKCGSSTLSSGASDEAALEGLALRCQEFTPLAAVDPPDGIMLDITGCAHLFGGEAALRARLAAIFPGAGLAIADTAMAARVLAASDGTGIDALPVTALGLDTRMASRMRRLGIRRIGELCRLSRGDLRAGFGAELLLLVDRLRGLAPEPLHFLPPPVVWREGEHHADPLLAAGQLRAALERLVQRLCDRLEAAERGMIRLVVRFHRVDARRVEDAIGFAAPTRDAVHVSRLLAGRLERIDPGFGVEALAIEAATAAMQAAQPELGGAADPDYAQTLDRLAARAVLSRIAPAESHVPERAMRRVPVTAPPPRWIAPAHPRPVRLLARPEPVEMVAPMPDDPPRLMIRQGRRHRIVRATGPERIARDWWLHPPDGEAAAARPEAERVRDYYAIEDSAGLRFWVFRVGLHGGVQAPRWFVHGLF